ncbi:glutathione S-transferase family protein [Methylovulum miyakonense]|uniref:glutathione S-transferase family protein n=1 Tax=Methylovulum miyakonense TaxID=645578 RepID=UPI0003795F19|nr:glutathione S-transferase family protein [Methylovulum miyakonense]
MKLYDYPKSGNGYKARLLLAQLNQPYDYIPLDILRGETRTDSFLQKNPNGRIPLLELDDGTFLPESNAILFFLAQGSRYWPSATLEQAQVLQWLFFEQYSHEPNIATARFWLSIKGLEDTPFNNGLLAQKQKQGRAALEVMETHLNNRPFFVGDRYTIADMALYAYTHVAGEGGFTLSDYPNVSHWLGRVCGQPGHVTLGQWQSAAS